VPARTHPRTADGYIRVSRVAGREGESFISPETQRQKIEVWAQLHGLEVVRWWEELDQSGAKRQRPMFQEALARYDDRRLVIVPDEAAVIREVFRRRANGASWTELADFLTESGVKSSNGSAAWSVTGASSLVKNRVYLGEARSGKYVNPTAHEPIVTQAEFDAAQSQRTLLKPHDGSVNRPDQHGRSGGIPHRRQQPPNTC
jgi:Recombinase/Resolvase, N terminal domain